MGYYTAKQYAIVEDSKETNVFFYTFFREIEGPILDIGCGIGNFVALDKERIAGIDIDKDSLDICAKRKLNTKYMSADKKLDFLPNSFSAIHSSYVIEHTTDPLLMLKEVRRILKPGGKLVLVTNNWGHNLASVIGFYDDYTHKKPFTKYSLEMIAHDAGFKEYCVIHPYKAVSGFGWLTRKKTLKPEYILAIQKLLAIFGIKNRQQLLLIARK